MNETEWTSRAAAGPTPVTCSEVSSIKESLQLVAAHVAMVQTWAPPDPFLQCVAKCWARLSFHLLWVLILSNTCMHVQFLIPYALVGLQTDTAAITMPHDVHMSCFHQPSAVFTVSSHEGLTPRALWESSRTMDLIIPGGRKVFWAKLEFAMARKVVSGEC